MPTLIRKQQMMKAFPLAPVQRLCVLKFGSSVLRVENDFPEAALEIYRHVRDGEKVVAVVSALAGQTDALLNQADRVGGNPPPALVARLARVGELHSAALLALALSRVGVRACTMDPHEMSLMAQGEPLDSDLQSLNPHAVLAKLSDHEVVVVPGFTAGHSEHGVVTLGRGGTDLSAVFFAARLNAHRVRLIKDVDGVYAEDPAKSPLAERYSQMSYAEASQASAGLIQPKAIHAAEAEDVLIEVAALGQSGATTISHMPARKSRPLKNEKLRVALLGCGAVGAGVLVYLQGLPDLFHVNPVLVRKPETRGQEARFTDQLMHALEEDPDVVIEVIGGADYPAEIMCAALRRGAQVVTANKAAVARHYDALHACAAAGGATFAYSGAVGGGTPILETLQRLKGQVASIEGVMNGTGNFLLSRLGEGWSFEDSVRKAQELGFAEADPAADALAGGEVLKQVGRCRLEDDGSVSADVRIERLPASHPLAGAVNEENRFLVHDLSGAVHEIYGKGAGRWPTAAAVFADVMDVQRALLGRASERAVPVPAPVASPVLMRA
jgi:homoserine dehydrogenase